MHLRALGQDVEQHVKERLFLDSLNSIRENRFIIVDDGSVNFNLRALITGIDLILTSILSKTIEGFLLNENKIKELYTNKIPGALFLDTDGINPGISNLTFAKGFSGAFPTLCECISHELGHNYLEALGLESTNKSFLKSFANTTYHEFFAFTIQGLFNEAITHGKVTRSIRSLFSVLSLNLFSIPRLFLSVLPRSRSNFTKVIYAKLVWLESISTPLISIGAISTPSLFITSLSGCLYISVIGSLIPIGYIMRRLMPYIGIGMEGLAHIDALSLLRSVEIADSKGLNFLVTTKLAIEFLKAGWKVGYNSADPEYKMVDKFIKFTLDNLERIHKEILDNSLNDVSLTKEEIIILIKLHGVSKEAVKKNIKKSYAGGVKLLTDTDIFNALKENKVLTESDAKLKTQETKSEEEIDKEKEDHELQLPFLTRMYKGLNISKEGRAVMTGILELEHIMKASVDRGYFEEFLKMHGEESEKRRAGLLAITRAVNAALSQTGVSLSERMSNALERAIGLHTLWNMGYVEEVIGAGNLGSNSIVTMEYHAVKGEELEELIDEFGSEVRVGVNGDISMPVYVIREKLGEGEGEVYKFENSGVNIGRNTIWIGEYRNAVVIYVEGGESGDIAREIETSKKVKEIIKEKVEASVKGMEVKDIEIEIEGIEVGRIEEEEEGISYSENGDIRVRI